MASFYFNYGAMDSSKSASLLMVAHNYESKNMKVLLLKPSIDTKEEDYIISRIGLKRKADYLIGDKFEEEFEKQFDLNEYSCILVDEAQFLKRKDVDYLDFLKYKYDIPIICYGLRLDFAEELFEGSARLLAIADKISEIKTVCACGKKATRNIRLINGKVVFEGDKVLIDNNDKVEYVSVCSKCYKDMKNGI